MSEIDEEKLKKFKENPKAKKIIDYYNGGMTQEEIGKLEDIQLSQSSVSRRIKKGREFGLVNSKEVEFKENPKAKKTINYYNGGMTQEEIGKLEDIRLSQPTVGSYIKKGKEYGLVNSDKQIKEARKIRKQKILNEFDKPNKEKEKNNKKIPKSELLLLKEKLLHEQIEVADISNFIKQCISIEEYEEALNVVRGRYQLKVIIPKKEEIKFKKIEESLVKACKVQTVIQMIEKGNGNTNIEEISEKTGLLKETIAIIEMKLHSKQRKFISISTREQIIDEFIKGRTLNEIRGMFNVSDYELLDIENQAKYRKIRPGKRDFEAKVKQNSKIRIVVLATKLGKKPETIVKGLKLNLETVKIYIENALKVKLIKPDELQGVDFLAYVNSSDKERIS